MSIEGQGHFFTIYFPDFVCFVLYYAKISGEHLQDHWSSGLLIGIFVINAVIVLTVLINCPGKVWLQNTLTVKHHHDKKDNPYPTPTHTTYTIKTFSDKTFVGCIN